MALATIGAIGTVVAVVGTTAKALYEMLKIAKKDVKKEVVHAQQEEKMESYTESIVIKHCEGIDLNKWAQYFTRLCKRYEIPNNVKEDVIADVEACDKSRSNVHEFVFKNGAGHLCLGRFAAIKRNDNKVDYAMWYFKCDFELKPKKIIHQKRKYLIGKTQVIEYQAVSLSPAEQSVLDSYFFNRAISLFEKEAPNALSAANQKQIEHKAPVKKCIKANCVFYGRQETNGYCSKCFNK
eukprot:189187_1